MKTMIKLAVPDFSYNLSRPVPWAWYTPAVVLGGLLLLIGLSALNYAVNGFYLAVEYTTTPNATVTQQWVDRGILSWFSKVQRSCQPVNLAVQSTLYTSKLSMPYTITNIWRESDDKLNSHYITPALTYMENPLENCTMPYIGVNLQQGPMRTAEQTGWTTWGLNAMGLVTCYVSNSQGLMGVNLSTTYDLVPVTIGSGATYSFLNTDSKDQASLWWAQSLLEWNWLGLVTAMSKNSVYNGSLTGNKPTNIIQGTINQFLNMTYHDDITRLYRRAGYHFILADGNVLHGGDNRFPNITTEWLTFSKSFYSAVMADLGSTMTVNIVNDPVLLQQYSNFTHMINESDVDNQWRHPGPARDSYENLKNNSDIGALGITPSTFYTQFLCQVPKRKPTGQLLVSVLVADLVLLSALWALVKLATTIMIDRRSVESQYCQGCREILLNAKGDGQELGSMLSETEDNTITQPTSTRLRAGAGIRHSSNISTNSALPLLDVGFRAGDWDYDETSRNDQSAFSSTTRIDGHRW